MSLQDRSFSIAHATGVKRRVVFLDTAEAEVERWKQIAQDRCSCIRVCGDTPEESGGVCKELPRA
jgi:uncharacterized OsmC-like protein